jgi:hypothetical protein
MDAVFRTVPLFLSAFSATRVFASLPRPRRLSLGFNLASASRLSKDDDEAPYAPSSSTGIASHTSRHPGKFHVLGKPAH